MSETVSIEDRISLLEEQNEGLKRSGLLLVILVVLMGATMIYQSRALAGALSTGGLILNHEGTPKAALTAMPNGHLGFVFFDSQGNLAEAQYGSIPYLDGFAVYDRAGRPRIHIGIDDRDNPILRAYSATGQVLFSALPAEEQAAPPNPQPSMTPAPSVTATPAP